MMLFTLIQSVSTLIGSLTIRSRLLQHLATVDGKVTFLILTIFTHQLHVYSVCPGSQFAESNLFMLISSLMYIFDIRRMHDESGNEIIPEVIKNLNTSVSS